MEKKSEITQVSEYVKLPSGDKLHLRRIYANPTGPVVFMVHGSIENGEIFYTTTGKGLGPHLASKGLDVWICDLRGRGKSTPKISRDSKFGQTETITEDIPAFLNHIKSERGSTPQHWVAHSWGGVLLLSAMARFPSIRDAVKTITFIGTKKSIRVWNLEKLFTIDLLWNNVFSVATRLFGFLPAVQMNIGSDNESFGTHQQTKRWVKLESWIDPVDGFDYEKQIRNIDLPPILSITGKNDKFLGHPMDVERFLKQSGAKNYKLQIFSKENGQKQDYGHVDILVHPDSKTDLYPLVSEWILGPDLKSRDSL